MKTFHFGGLAYFSIYLFIVSYVLLILILSRYSFNILHLVLNSLHVLYAQLMQVDGLTHDGLAADFLFLHRRLVCKVMDNWNVLVFI